ncbi:MAG: nicotinate phosphoribosyltransferase, partial [Candidatus Sericytochromatia bacterium]
SNSFTIIDPMDQTRMKTFSKDDKFEDLLKPIFVNGECIYESPSIGEIRNKTQDNLKMFHSGIKRFVNPHQYPVGLEKSLHDMKTDLILLLIKLN